MKLKISNVLEKTKWLAKTETLFFVSQIILLLLLCFLHSLSAGHSCDFNPINGTFQNFNPVRRLLSGQIPYRDFSAYLGLGHLYAGSIFTFLFGGNYQASLIAFSFLQIFSLALISVCIGKAILKNTRISVCAANIFLTVLLLQPAFYSNGIISGVKMKNALNSCLGVGNSARFVRGMILGIFMILFFAGEKKISALIDKKLLFKKYSHLVYTFCFGNLAGFSALWSNDYGISAFVCAFCAFSWIVFCKTRNLTKSSLLIVVYLFASMIGLFFFGEIFTFGHFGSWLKNTFGVGDFQRWYYTSDASSYIFDIDLSFLTIVQLLLCFAYGAKIFICRADKESIFRYGIPAFCNLTAYCAVNEYKLLSGGLIYEVAYSVLFLTLAFEAISFLKNNSRINKKHTALICHTISISISIAWLVSALFSEILFYSTAKPSSRITELGRGGGVRMYSDIISAKEFLGDKKIFSTYASAQEVVQNQFQPSGFDYIIHVLGDEQRKKYLESFRKGDFDYAVTIREEHNDWENWIKRANWFFYRELYRNYSPVFENGYKRYWQKNESGQENAFDAKSGSISLKIEDINPSTKKIIISAPKYVSGTADVLIDYEIRKNKAARKSKFIFNMNLLVQETALNSKNTNSLRAKSKEYIPIEIKNGRGEAILSSKPVGSTMLEIKEVRCDEIFYIPKVILLSPITDKNWTKGILNSNKQTLLFAYDAKLLEKIQESDILQAQNEKFFIVKVENDSKWIRVTVDKDASACAYPANIAFSNQGIEFDIDSLFENAEDE